MRALFFAALFSMTIGAAAVADENVSGKWRANVGGGVIINMNVTADGEWSSETLQRNRVVRQMKGTYKQTPSNEGSGTIVFTPTQSSVKSGEVEPENDQYEMANKGRQMKLTSDGDTMVFNKQQGR